MTANDFLVESSVWASGSEGLSSTGIPRRMNTFGAEAKRVRFTEVRSGGILDGNERFDFLRFK